MISWPAALLSAGGVIAAGFGLILVDIDRELNELRRKLESRDALDLSHEELLNAALEEELPTPEVRERAWEIFLQRNGLS